MVTNSRFYYIIVRRGGPSRSFGVETPETRNTERKELKVNFRRARARSLPSNGNVSSPRRYVNVKIYFNDFYPYDSHSSPQKPNNDRKNNKQTYMNFIIIFRDYFYFPEQEHGYATSLPVPLETTKLRATTMASKKMSRGGSKKTQGNR